MFKHKKGIGRTNRNGIRLLVLMLVFAMILQPMISLFGTPAYAEEEVQEVTQTVSEAPSAEEVKEPVAAPVQPDIQTAAPAPSEGHSDKAEAVSDTKDQDEPKEQAGESACDSAEEEEDDAEEEDEEDEMPAQSFTGSVSGLSVSVSAPEGALPADSKMKVTAVNKGRVIAAAEKVVDDDVKDIRAADIAFYNKDGKEIEPDKAVSVSMKASGLDAKAEKAVVHIDDSGKAEKVNATVSGKGSAQFKSDEFSIYAVVETGSDARLFVNFYNGDTALEESSITLNQLGEIKTQIYDPGAGTLEQGQVFKGWTTNKNYTVAGLDDGTNPPMTIEQVRNEITAKLQDADHPVHDGDTVNYYAMIFEACHVSYRDELEVTVHTDEVLYKSGAEIIPYTVEHSYSPYFATTIDDEGNEQTAEFTGWKQMDPQPEEVTVYQNEQNIDLKALGLSGDNSNLTLLAQVAYGHWLVFNENGAGATYTEPVFVQKNQDTVEPTPPTRNGYDFKGWYTDEECTEGNEFVFGEKLKENTTVYAKWKEATKASFTVLIWEESLKEGTDYDFVRSITIDEAGTGDKLSDYIDAAEEASAIKVNNEDVFIPRGSTNRANEGFIYDHYAGNNDGKVKSDGTSVLNVYFNRREYTLKFYYGATTGSSWRIAHNNSNSAYTWGAPGGFTPNYSGSLTKGTDRTGDGKVSGGTYYYAAITAKYGADISASWPKYNDFAQGSSDQNYFNSWILMPGAGARTGQYGGNITVKGKITIMDEQILGNLASSTGNYLVGQYNTSPNQYTYFIYFKGLESTQGTRTYHGETYGLYETVDVRSGSDYANQHAPAYRGYQKVHEENNGRTGKTGREIYYFYDPLSYPILFMDGLYVKGNKDPIKNLSSDTLKSYQDEEAVPYQADISSYPGKFDATKLIDDGSQYVLLGWYSDDACTKPYTFNKMPEGGVKVYAKWMLKEYEIVLHPNVDGDDSFRYINGKTEGHYSDEGDVFWVDNGEAIGNVGGTRDYYELIGWFANSGLTKVWNFDFDLNDTVVAKYGKLYKPSEIDPEFPSTVGKIELYASWRKVLEGADGIDIVYDAAEGTNPPKDQNSYTDQAKAIAYPACKAPEGSDKEFDCWVVQKWNEETEAYEPTDVKVYPGDRYTVLKDNAKQVVTEWKDKEGHKQDYPDETHNIISKATYTVKLVAQYSSKEEEILTHINWYKNYGEGGKYREDKDLKINESVKVYGTGEGESIPSRTGYTFKGWAREADKGETTTSTIAFVKYEDGAYNHNQVAADEKMVDTKYYHAMYALWAAKDVKYKVEYYYQDEDGKYPEDPTDTSADRNSHTDEDVSVTNQDKTPTDSDKYVLDESKNTDWSAKAAWPGPTVLKVYFKLKRENITIKITGATGTKTYNGEDQTVTGFEATSSYESFDPSKVKLAEDKKAEAKGKDVMTEDPGKYMMDLTPEHFIYDDDSVNAAFEIEEDGWLKISRKSVTVTADSFSKVVGELDPEWTATADGLLGDDTVVYTISREPGSTPGEYKIIVAGEEEQGNYAVTYVDGTLTIKPAPSPDPGPDPTPTPEPTPTPDPTPTPRPTPPTTAVRLADTAIEETAQQLTTVEDTKTPQATIGDDKAPKATNEGYWALINLICTVLTCVISILLLVFYFIKRREDDEEEERNSKASNTEEDDEAKRRNKLGMRLLGLIAAIGSVIVFILTEDISLPMQMVDKWTIVMAIILAIEAVLAVFSKKTTDEDEDRSELAEA